MKQLQPEPVLPGLWQRLHSHRLFVFALGVLILFAAVALLAPFLANNKPLYLRYAGHHLFPAFTFKKVYRITVDGRTELLPVQSTEWRQLPAQRVVWAPVPFGPLQSNFSSAGYQPPMFRPEAATETGNLPPRHWLGTGKRGNDLLAALIHGARTSLLVGLASVAVALVLGLFFGAVSGFYGDRRLQWQRGRLVALLPAALLAWYYAFTLDAIALLLPARMAAAGVGHGLLQLLCFVIVFAGVMLMLYPLQKIKWMNKPVHVPVDALVTRLTEIVMALPLLFLLVTLSAVSKPSLWNVIWLIGLTGWTGIARLVRAEMIRVRELEFIRAAQLMGLSYGRILLRHALPNAWMPALFSVSFGVGNVILAESALSFLGIGMPAHVPSWGALISAGKENLQAWWLIVFPGLCIMAVVFCFNVVGEALRDALDPRQQLG